MISALIESHFRKNRDLIINEAKEMEAFMQLLMKQRNTGLEWTKPEKTALKRYLRSMVFLIPALIIFLLPGGFLLIPVLAEVMDRRKRSRISKAGLVSLERLAAENRPGPKKTCTAQDS